MTTVNEKMTALANEIRELSGTTTSKSIDAMTTDVNAANENINEQSNLISQISTLVATKVTPPSTDTNDATATAGDILSGKTAYAKGQKLVGTHTCSEDLESELVTQENLISQLNTILDNKASGGSGGVTTAPVFLTGPVGTTMYYIGESGVE